MELGTFLFCGINSFIIALVTYVPLSLKISKYMVCCCLLCSVLTHQCLLTRLETFISLANVDCRFCCWTIYGSGAKLQSSLDLGGQRAGWEDTLILPLFYLTPHGKWPPTFFLCWLTCPGMLSTKLNCFPFSSHFYLTIILCFCFCFCLALKKNNITKFPNVHSRVRISSSTPVVEDTQSWQASLFT